MPHQSTKSLMGPRHIEKLEWVTSEGGPLILLSEDALGFWDGVRGSGRFREVRADFRWSTGTGPTDYDRACDVAGYIGVIDVGPDQAVVLGDAPMSTAWLPSGRGAAGYLVRWIEAEDDLSVCRAMQHIPESLIWIDCASVKTGNAPLVLFDAGTPGDSVPARAPRIRLGRGRYVIATAEYATAGAHLLIHRFGMLAPERGPTP